MSIYTPDKLADLLGVSKCTVLRMIRAGEFGETINVARQHLVTEEALSDFLSAHTGPASNSKRRTASPRSRAAKRNPGPI